MNSRSLDAFFVGGLSSGLAILAILGLSGGGNLLASDSLLVRRWACRDPDAGPEYKIRLKMWLVQYHNLVGHHTVVPTGPNLSGHFVLCLENGQWPAVIL